MRKEGELTNRWCMLKACFVVIGDWQYASVIAEERTISRHVSGEDPHFFESRSLIHFCLVLEIVLARNRYHEYQETILPLNEEDSPTLNLPIWPLDGALDKGRRFGGRRWRQGKTS
jgi:hypothetical protein